MPTNKEVLDVIEKWSGQRPPKMSQQLEEWWNKTAPGSTHSGLLFDPDGIADLVKRLKKAFPNPPHLEAADFKATGTVRTVQDLVNALQPTLPSPPTAALVARPAALQSAKPAKVSGKTQKKKKAKKTRAGKPAKKGPRR
jgi:hypothetical protein